MHLKNKFFHEETGAVLVLVALAMAVIFGCLAISIDYGMTAAERRRMVSAADAAALAGAQEMIKQGLPDKPLNGTRKTRIIGEVKKYALLNKANLSDSDIEVYKNEDNQYRVSVKVNKDVNHFFSKVMGALLNSSDSSLEKTNVTAKSVAGIGYPTKITKVAKGNILPLLLPKEVFTEYVNEDGTPKITESTEVKLMFGHNFDTSFVMVGGQLLSGNFGALDLGGKFRETLAGTADVSVELEVGQDYEVSGVLVTEPGNMTGQVRQGVDYRLNSESIEDFGVVPIISRGEKNGKTIVTIDGFTVYEITGYDDNGKIILGNLRFDLSPEDYIEWEENIEINYGVKLAVLVE